MDRADSTNGRRQEYAQAACVNGRIFIVGGCNRDRESSVERFDPFAKRFSYVSPLSEPREESVGASVQVSASVLKRLLEKANAKS